MNRLIKAIVAAVALFAMASIAVMFAASAATPEDDYIAARDVAIARFKAADKAGPIDDKTLDAEKDALAKLERRLNAILEPVAVKDLPKASAINFDTLFDFDEGFGLLDGLICGADTDKTHIIVTTENLFRRWLRQHKDWWGKDSADIPQEMSDAVRADAFYTQAISADAAVTLYGELPMRKPAGMDFAFATLAARSQDRPPPVADEIFIVVARGDRIFVAYTKDFAALGSIAACEAVRRDYDKKATEIYKESTLSSEEQSRQSERLSGKSDTEFVRCFKERAPQQAGFAAAAQAAQTLLERLAAR
jgi:hypothetical protein